MTDKEIKIIAGIKHEIELEMVEEFDERGYTSRHESLCEQSDLIQSIFNALGVTEQQIAETGYMQYR